MEAGTGVTVAIRSLSVRIILLEIDFEPLAGVSPSNVEDRARKEGGAFRKRRDSSDRDARKNDQG
jgi:hypothetical protein